MSKMDGLGAEIRKDIREMDGLGAEIRKDIRDEWEREHKKVKRDIGIPIGLEIRALVPTLIRFGVGFGLALSGIETQLSRIATALEKGNEQ